MSVQPEPVVLEGAHVRLEPLSLEHLDPLSEIAFDPEIWRWMPTSASTRDELRDYIEQALAERDSGRALPFAAVDRASGRIAGSTRYGNIDAPQAKLEIGWTWLGAAFRRTALNTEAKYLLLRHAFEDLGYRRVELKTDALNERSRAAILRIGAVQEGIFRKHMLTSTGRIRDTVWFSIVDDEWPAVKARLEERLAHD